MKTFLILCAAMLAAALPHAQTARADFEPATWSLAELALRSEIIVVGTVGKVEDSIVTVNVVTVVAVDFDDSTLKLKNSENEGCGPSWGLYTEGQLFVWFLVKNLKGDGTPTEEYCEAGGCAQGEMPVFGQTVYCANVDIGGESKCHKEGEREIYGLTADLDDLTATIKALRECFKLNDDGTIVPTCTDDVLKREAGRSELAKHAFEHTARGGRE